MATRVVQRGGDGVVGGERDLDAGGSELLRGAREVGKGAGEAVGVDHGVGIVAMGDVFFYRHIVDFRLGHGRADGELAGDLAEDGNIALLAGPGEDTGNGLDRDGAPRRRW